MDVGARTRAGEAGGTLTELSHAISADPELAYQEHRAAERCAGALESHGLIVERGAYGLETAFAARAGSRGPHVVVCAEYDALPGVGHACGHNIIAASAVGRYRARGGRRAGRPRVPCWTPRKRVGGAGDLIRRGFEGVDAAMMVHPAPFDVHSSRGLAIEEWEVVYTGQASHASFAPHLGRNALDGLVAGYTAIAMLRQHLRPRQQVHGIITEGGEAANVVPERAAGIYYLRATDAAGLVDLRLRVRACLEGAATATGTTVEIIPQPPYEPRAAPGWRAFGRPASSSPPCTRTWPCTAGPLSTTSASSPRTASPPRATGRCSTARWRSPSPPLRWRPTLRSLPSRSRRPSPRSPAPAPPRRRPRCAGRRPRPSSSGTSAPCCGTA